MITEQLQGCSKHDTDSQFNRCLVAHTGGCPLCLALTQLEFERTYSRSLRLELSNLKADLLSGDPAAAAKRLIDEKYEQIRSFIAGSSFSPASFEEDETA